MANGVTQREAEVASAIADIQEACELLAKHESEAALRIGVVLSDLTERDGRVAMALEVEHLDREAAREGGE